MRSNNITALSSDTETTLLISSSDSTNERERERGGFGYEATTITVQQPSHSNTESSRSPQEQAFPVLRRHLTARHINMIAIGGTIGTGLFIGSGATLAEAGPGGSLLGFSLVAFLVYCIMNSLGELATHMPVSGSFTTYAGILVDPALSFALGWNYWLQWSVSFPSELSAAGIIMAYWTPSVPSIIWSALILVILLGIHLFGVKGFGETEYWLSLVKVVAIVCFIIAGLLVDLGILGSSASNSLSPSSLSPQLSSSASVPSANVAHSSTRYTTTHHNTNYSFFANSLIGPQLSNGSSCQLFHQQSIILISPTFVHKNEWCSSSSSNILSHDDTPTHNSCNNEMMTAMNNENPSSQASSYIGFQNWFIPGAPFKNGVQGVFKVFLLAFFAFGGTELIGVTAGEAQSPSTTIPKAIKQTFWRIWIFYIFSIFVMGLVIRNDDPYLLLASKSGNVAIAPFTLVFERAGLRVAAHVMNGVVFSAVLSAGNSALFAASRTLMALAVEKRAPALFATLNSRGVPVYAILMTGAFGCLAFLAIFSGDGQLFVILVQVTGISGILTWLSIAIIHIRFRGAFLAQGRSVARELAFRAPFYPVGPVVAIVLGLGIIAGQAWAASLESVYLFLVTFAGIPLFLGLYIYYKLALKTSIVDLKDIDLDALAKMGRSTDDDDDDDDDLQGREEEELLLGEDAV